MIPTWTYSTAWALNRQFLLRWKPVPDVSDPYKGGQHYTQLAINESPEYKLQYRSEEIMAAWENAMKPQLLEEVIAFFDNLTFDEIKSICEKKGDREKNIHWGYGRCEYDHFSAAYHCLWDQEYEKGLDFMEKGVAYFEKQSQWRDDPIGRKDTNHAKELISILRKKPQDWEAAVAEKLQCIEKAALEGWGIALDKKGQMVKLKKKVSD